jgi:hypothetical protein
MLKVSDLNIDRVEKSKRNHELYKNLLESLYQKIKNKNSEGFKNYVFKLPYTYIYQHRLKPDRALQYIIIKLNKGGFITYPYGSQHSLYIDWSIDVKSKTKRVSFVTPKNKLTDNVLNVYRKQFKNK